MKKKRLPYLFLIFLSSVLINSCAVPIPPSGGPPDKTAPVIEYTIPESGTTNFSGNTFEFQFNEYINRSSVAGAITVEPDLGLDYEVNWKRRTMFIDFEKDFPDSTTIILKLDGSVSDVRGNRMEKTTTLAISTGNKIDSGEISGKVLLAKSGRGAQQKRILLYRAPIDFSQRANYEIGTDTSGSFTFSYLREGKYQALLVDDRNRNKIWEQSIELAQPFSQEFITLNEEESDTLDILYTTQTDTIKPNILGVGLFSTNRLRLRFSESIELNEQVELNISDSTGADYSTAYPLYISPEESFVLFAQSQKPLIEDTEYFLRINGITDLNGNSADTSGIAFMGSAQEDTTIQRLISTNESKGIEPQQAFVITYAAPITESEITDSVVVIEGDVDFEDWPEIETYRNKLFIHPQGEWIAEIDYQFLVWNPTTSRRKMYQPATWDSTEFGDIELLVNSDDSASVFIFQLLSATGDVIRTQSFSQQYLITKLAPLSYTIVVFQDVNQNGNWDMGTVIPYRAPEPYYVQRGINVQEGFTSQVEISFASEKEETPNKDLRNFDLSE